MGILNDRALTDLGKKFYVVGVNFQKTDAQQRGKFSITTADSEKAYSTASPCLEHYTILSTCNRTEIYAHAPCEYVLLSFLKSLSGVSHEEIKASTYIKEGEEAVNHLLTVASGLDSQIPGDYEIIGQIRNAFQLSKKLGRANGYIEKVVNQAVLVSKTIKNTTAFSDGTVSVSYTVVQHIKKMMEQQGLKKIAVIGLGEIGYNTLKYLLQHTPDAEITIVNRDEKKLNEIALQHQLKAVPFTSLNKAVSENEILIFATGVSQPILYLDQIKNTNVRYIYDLSMPRNVAEEVYDYPNVNVYDVDQVSKVVNETIDKRLAEIPKVKAIVKEKAQEFFDWEKRRKQHMQTPAPYEQMNNHVIADTTHSHARQFACFMADQCCEGNPAAAWIPVRAYSA